MSHPNILEGGVHCCSFPIICGQKTPIWKHYNIPIFDNIIFIWCGQKTPIYERGEYIPFPSNHMWSENMTTLSVKNTLGGNKIIFTNTLRVNVLCMICNRKSEYFDHFYCFVSHFSFFVNLKSWKQKFQQSSDVLEQGGIGCISQWWGATKTFRMFQTRSSQFGSLIKECGKWFII